MHVFPRYPTPGRVALTPSTDPQREDEVDARRGINRSVDDGRGGVYLRLRRIEEMSTVPVPAAIVLLVSPVATVMIVTISKRRAAHRKAADSESHRDDDPGAHHVPLFAAASMRLRNTLSAVFFCASDMVS